MGLAGEPNRPWTDDGVELVVAAYFDLLAAELRGERPTKATRVRELQRLMPARTTGSIEFKLGNISAVLDEFQEPWVDGYKPYPIATTPTRSRRRATWSGPPGPSRRSPITSRTPCQRHRRGAGSSMTCWCRPRRPGGSRRRSIGLTTGVFGALRDLQNRRLGKAGEEFVLDAERLSLDRAGRTDLAERVRWVAVLDGDGAGYDIASFRRDGTPRLIEVKTTNLGARTPFHITRWEVEVSGARPRPGPSIGSSTSAVTPGLPASWVGR